MVTHTNPTVKQTEDVIKYKLDTFAKPHEDLVTMSDKEIDALRKHISDCIIERDDTRGMKIRNPCAPFLYDLIPTLFPIARSKVHYYLKLINAVARFYPGELVRVERDGITYGLITPKHNWLATQIYIDTFVTECLQMPSHGVDILKLIPNSDVDKYGMLTSEVIKMSKSEIQQAARQVGLPFAQKNINPLLTSLVMLGFLEQEEEDKKLLYFKSTLVREPSTKIDWSDLMRGTQELMKNTWPEIADEYNKNYCTKIEVEDPFTREKQVLSIGEEREKISSDKVDYGGWYA